MQLGVRDVAKLLKVSERTVYRWIKQKTIPAIKVYDEYHFNRAELLEWATSQRLPVSLDIFNGTDDKPDELPTLTQALQKGGIFSNVPGKDKKAVLAEVVKLLPLPAHTDRDFLLKILLAREELGSTGIGEGIAIPHVRNPIVLNVPQSMIALCSLAEPIDFGAIDSQPVHSLFLLITPTVRVHLHLLSRLGYALRDPEFRAVLIRRAPGEEIIACLQNVEMKIKQSSKPQAEGQK